MLQPSLLPQSMGAWCWSTAAEVLDVSFRWEVSQENKVSYETFAELPFVQCRHRKELGLVYRNC